MSEKKFIGRVQQIPTKFGEMVKISFGPKDKELMAKEDWTNLVLKTSKEGKMFLEIDDWKPEKKNEKPSIAEDLPF